MTAALLGTGATAVAQQNTFESSLLLYSETNRVKALEGVASLSKMLPGDRILGLKLTFDGLTGASPNGATPSNRIQTFTNPSGNGSSEVQPGQVPLDENFRDTRYALDGNITQPIGRMSNLIGGGHFSIEHDYTSIGLNAGMTRDFNRKNTTLGVSGSFSHDIISPLGGPPVAFSSMPPPSEGEGEGEGEHEHEDDGEGIGGGSETKNVFDAMVSLSQVLDRKTIFRMNYSFDRSLGYMNDPYKILSVVQNAGGDNPGEPVDYIYERRPDSRNKQALFGELRRYIAGSTLDLSYRYFWDDWGITSHTIDFLYRLSIKGNRAIEPHIRWYHQTAADFHKYYLVEGQPLPQYASADSRLSNFSALTFGLQYSFPIVNNSRIKLSAEYYTQFGKRGPPNAIGVLSNYDLFPRLNVLMFRFGFSHDL